MAWLATRTRDAKRKAMRRPSDDLNMDFTEKYDKAVRQPVVRAVSQQQIPNCIAEDITEEW